MIEYETLMALFVLYLIATGILNVIAGSTGAEKPKNFGMGNVIAGLVMIIIAVFLLVG